MKQTAIYVWLGLCALVAVVSAMYASNLFPDIEQFAPGRFVPGTPTDGVWLPLIRFQRWAFMACFATGLGLLSLGIMRQQQVRVVLVVCVIAALWYGREAIDRGMITTSFTGSGAAGSPVWWETYLEFQRAAWRSLIGLGVGLAIMIGATWWSSRSPAVPAASPVSLTDQM